MTRIIYKNDNIVVIYKSQGIPSQPDPSGDKDAMTLTGDQLYDMKESQELYLIHRLDRVVGGLMVFARNKKYAAILSSIVAERQLIKEYLAVVEGELCDGEFVDYLYKDSSLNKAFVVNKVRSGAKKAELSFKVLDTVLFKGRSVSLVKVSLKTGRYHQIRAQFSSHGSSLLGDKKYGNKDSSARFPSLFAYRLAFDIGSEKYDFIYLPVLDSYPWSLFSKEKYEENTDI